MIINYEAKENFKIVIRACNYIVKYKFKFYLTLFTILAGILFGLIQPLIWGKVLTSLFSKELNRLIILITLLAAIYFVILALDFLQSYLFTLLSEGIISDLKCSMFSKVLDLPVSAFDDMKIGEFISRIHNDATIVGNILTNQLISSIVDIIKVIVIGCFIFRINIQLAMLVLLSFPITLLIFIHNGRKVKEISMNLSKTNDQYFSNLHQTIFGIREIKSLGIKDNRYKDYELLSNKLKDTNTSLNARTNLSKVLSQCTNYITQILVIALGGYFIIKGTLTMDLFVAFSSYSVQFSLSLLSVCQINTKMQQAIISLKRIFALIDNLHLSKEQFGDIDINDIKGEIIFKDIGFNYKENNPVLKNISFKIANNQKTVIMGENGSGKSTLLKLLLNFYKPTEGSIQIDGININDFSEKSLRKHISVVHQEPFLFNMSIRDNLRIVNPFLSEEEIIRACKDSLIHDFIISLPEQYDTLIDENGVNLSGGQKQRIAIARAILKKSKVIIFDEATSAIDNISQLKISKVTNLLSKDHTIIVISHRLSHITDSDEIIVINNGQIEASGNHDYLIKTSLRYKNLYESDEKCVI